MGKIITGLFVLFLILSSFWMSLFGAINIIIPYTIPNSFQLILLLDLATFVFMIMIGANVLLIKGMMSDNKK